MQKMGHCHRLPAATGLGTNGRMTERLIPATNCYLYFFVSDGFLANLVLQYDGTTNTRSFDS